MISKPKWNGDLNRAYHREEWEKLVFVSKPVKSVYDL